MWKQGYITIDGHTFRWEAKVYEQGSVFGIGASIDAGGHAPDRHHAAVIAFPCGTLGGAGIGQAPALGGHGLNRQGQHRKRINGFLHIRRRNAGLAVVVGNICRSAAGRTAATASIKRTPCHKINPPLPLLRP